MYVTLYISGNQREEQNRDEEGEKWQKSGGVGTREWRTEEWKETNGNADGRTKTKIGKRTGVSIKC